MKKNELKEELKGFILEVNTLAEKGQGLLKSTQGAIYGKEIGLMVRKLENSTRWADHIITNIERQEAEEEAAAKAEAEAKKRKEEAAKAKKLKEAEK